MEKIEDIKCFKCGMPLGFAKKNNFKFSHYGIVNFQLICDCGEIYLLKVNILRLLPGEIKNEWKKKD